MGLLAVLFDLKRFDYSVNKCVDLRFDIATTLSVENYATHLIERKGSF